MEFPNLSLEVMFAGKPPIQAAWQARLLSNRTVSSASGPFHVLFFVAGKVEVHISLCSFSPLFTISSHAKVRQTSGRSWNPCRRYARP